MLYALACCGLVRLWCAGDAVRLWRACSAAPVRVWRAGGVPVGVYGGLPMA